MAKMYSGTWSSFTSEQIEDVLSGLEGALSDLHIVWGNVPGRTSPGWIFYLGDSTDNHVAFFQIGNKLYEYAGNGNSLIFGGNVSTSSSKCRIVGTERAVAFTNIDANGVSRLGFVITEDSEGDICTIIAGGTRQISNCPLVVPRNAAYLTEIQYGGTTTTDFNCVALNRFPVPSFSKGVRCTPYVAFAHATMEMADGEVFLNGKNWYCLGGCWYLYDI